MARAALRKEEARFDLTPVIDISFLLIVFFLCLPFKSLDAKLQAWLPTSDGIVSTRLESPEHEVRIPVGVAARGLRDGRPERFPYRCGDVETCEIGDVEAYVARLKALADGAAGGRAVGEIRADRRTPHKFVVAILNVFAAQGVAEVRFVGVARPDAEARRQAPLRYPY